MQSPRSPRAFLFDFDGTLFDTEPLHFRAMAEAFARRGVMIDRRSYDERYLGLLDREAIRRAIDDRARADLRGAVEAIFADKAAGAARLLGAGVQPLDGAVEFVAEAAKRGPLAIVSGALRREIDTVLSRSAIAERFAVVVSGEDVRRGKPDPEGYRRALDALAKKTPGLRATGSVAIEDAPTGVEAAKAAGLRVVALTQSRPAAALGRADVVAAGYRALRWDELDALAP
jgi:beta-phosphoglucomutase